MTNKLFDTFVNQSFFQFLAKIAAMLTGFIFYILISRFLGPEIFGQFSLIHSIISSIVVFCIIGLPLTAQRFISQATGDYELQFEYVIIILRNYILLFAGTGFILFFSLDWLAVFFDLSAIAHHRLLILSILFVFGAWKVFEGIFKGYKKIQVNALQSFILGIVKVTVLLFLYWLLEPDLEVALLSFLAGYLLIDFLYLGFIWLIKTKNTNASFLKNTLDVAQKKELWKYSAIIFMTNVVAIVVTQTDRLMIGYFLGEKEVGFYFAAFKWAGFLLVAQNIIRPISGSIFSQLESENDEKSLAQLYFNIVRIVFLTGFPLFVVFWFYSGWFLSFFGPDFLAASSVLRFLSLAKLGQLMVGPIGMALVMSGLEKFDFYTNFIIAGLNFCLNLYLIPLWGITGAAVATFISWSLMLVVKTSIFMGYKRFFYYVEVRDFLKPFLIIITLPFYGVIKSRFFVAETLWNVTIILMFSSIISVIFMYMVISREVRSKILNLLKKRIGKYDS